MNSENELDKYDMAEPVDSSEPVVESEHDELVRVREELANCRAELYDCQEDVVNLKSELGDCLSKNKQFHEVNQKHLALLTEYKNSIQKNNEAIPLIQKHIKEEEIKLKNVAIAYHNLNAQWNSLDALKSRIKDLQKNSGIVGANGQYIGPKEVTKPDLVNEQGENLDGTPRDNISSKVNALNRLASAVAHGRVVERNGKKNSHN